MIKLKIYFIATICCVLLTPSCSKEDTPTAPTVSDQQKAEQFAWGVRSSIDLVAHSSATVTWSNRTVSGPESGSAVVNGSFTYNYNVNSGSRVETYNNVVIKFDKFSESSAWPQLTGTVIINGTCTTQYGWSTSYSGQWELVGENLTLSGKLSGTASIAMALRKGGMEWIAVVKTAEGTWNVSN